MKRLFTITICLIATLTCMAQRRAQSRPTNIDIDPNAMISIIQYVEGSLKFTDSDGNNTIDANEESYISLTIKNTGDGNGKGCIARINAIGTTQGIEYKEFSIQPIKKGETQEVRYHIRSNQMTQNGVAYFTVEIYEPHQMGTGAININIPTHQFEAPDVQIVSHQVLSNIPKLKRREPFTLRVMVQNLNQGKAEDVSVNLVVSSGLSLLSGKSQYSFATLAPNEKQIIDYELIATVDAQDEIVCELQLSEKYGRYAKNKSIDLDFGPKSTTIVDVHGTGQEPVEITPGTFFSDIDENIPISASNNINTFALIIANEEYINVTSVPFALNDGKSFKNYCIKTLGIPSENVRYVHNATGNTLKGEIKRLQNMIEAKNGEAKVIFYYVGHGMPDSHNGNGNAYLLPTDGYGNDYTTGYKLDDLYAALARYPSSGVTVFLDACFSGGTRNGTQTIDGDARGIQVRVKQGVPQGNTIVFAAARGDQTAHPYREKQHGYFTYFLLKKLKDTNGNVTMDELSKYVIDNVKLESSRNNTKQEPIITASPAVDADWRVWKLK